MSYDRMITGDFVKGRNKEEDGGELDESSMF